MKGALGIFGGSFDPPHLGHVLTACYALGLGDVDELWVAPVFAHPLNKPLTDYPHRVRMCELAFEELGACRVSDVERQLGQTSYTLDLVQAVAAREPGRPLRLVLGTDILAETDRWRDFARICELAPPLYVPRGGHPHETLPAGAPCMPEISSREVRARLARGETTRGLLPAKVQAYLREHQLYGGTTCA